MQELELDSENLELFIRAALEIKKSVRIAVSGSSMSPAIPEGAIIVVVPVDGSGLKKGMVALFRPLGRGLVAHRIVSLKGADGSQWIRVKGDAQPWSVRISQDRIIGVVESVVSGGERHGIPDDPGSLSWRNGMLFRKLRIAIFTLASWLIRRPQYGSH
jgi:hypothetical protein